MTQKYISVLVVMTLLAAASPVFAGELVNPNLLSDKLALPALASSPAMASGVALALPQSSQSQLAAHSGEGELTGKGKVFKWLGVGLMLGGGALIARGATVSNPCNAFAGPGVICTSNYQAVRAASLGVGGASAGAGFIMFLRHNHYRE